MARAEIGQEAAEEIRAAGIGGGGVAGAAPSGASATEQAVWLVISRVRARTAWGSRAKATGQRVDEMRAGRGSFCV